MTSPFGADPFARLAKKPPGMASPFGSEPFARLTKASPRPFPGAQQNLRDLQDEEDDVTFWGRITNFGFQTASAAFNNPTFQKVFNWLQAPVSANLEVLKQIVKPDPDDPRNFIQAWIHGFQKSIKSDPNFGVSFLQDVGAIRRDDNSIMNMIKGTALEIVLDPLNFLVYGSVRKALGLTWMTRQVTQGTEKAAVGLFGALGERLPLGEYSRAVKQFGPQEAYEGLVRSFRDPFRGVRALDYQKLAEIAKTEDYSTFIAQAGKRGLQVTKDNEESVKLFYQLRGTFEAKGRQLYQDAEEFFASVIPRTVRDNYRGRLTKGAAIGLGREELDVLRGMSPKEWQRRLDIALGHYIESPKLKHEELLRGASPTHFTPDMQDWFRSEARALGLDYDTQFKFLGDGLARLDWQAGRLLVEAGELPPETFTLMQRLGHLRRAYMVNKDPAEWSRQVHTYLTADLGIDPKLAASKYSGMRIRVIDPGKFRTTTRTFTLKHDDEFKDLFGLYESYTPDQLRRAALGEEIEGLSRAAAQRAVQLEEAVDLVSHTFVRETQKRGARDWRTLREVVDEATLGGKYTQTELRVFHNALELLDPARTRVGQRLIKQISKETGMAAEDAKILVGKALATHDPEILKTLGVPNLSPTLGEKLQQASTGRKYIPGYSDIMLESKSNMYSEIAGMAEKGIYTGPAIAVLQGSVKQREELLNLSEIARTFFGEYQGAIRRVTTGIHETIQTYNRAKILGELADNFGVRVVRGGMDPVKWRRILDDMPEAVREKLIDSGQILPVVPNHRGFRLIDKDARYGKLGEAEALEFTGKSGKTYSLPTEYAVPHGVHHMVNKATTVDEVFANPFLAFLDKLMTQFRLNKTIRSPAGVTRNFIGGFVQMDMAGMLPGGLPYLAKSFYGLAFPKSKLGLQMKELKRHGLGEASLTHAIMEHAEKLGAVENRLFQAANTTSNLTAYQGIEAGLSAFIAEKFWNPVKQQWTNYTRVMGEAWQATEDLYRGGIALYMMDHGASKAEAVRKAQWALYNYRDVPYFVDWARKTGFAPFLVFAWNATERVPWAMWNNPAAIRRMAAVQTNWWAAHALSPDEALDLDTFQRREMNVSSPGDIEAHWRALPQWGRAGMVVPLPLTDKHGQKFWLDLKYLVPLGFWPEIMRVLDPGHGTRVTPAQRFAAFGDVLIGGPYGQVLRGISTGRDEFGRQIYSRDAQALMQAGRTAEGLLTGVGNILSYAGRMFLPPWITPGGQIPQLLQSIVDRAILVDTPDKVAKLPFGVEYRRMKEEGQPPPPILISAMGLLGPKPLIRDATKDTVTNQMAVRTLLNDFRSQIRGVAQREGLTPQEKNEHIQILMTALLNEVARHRFPQQP